MMRFKAVLLTILVAIATHNAYATEPICKVIDGDTFHLCNGFKVRLDSVDTPEKGEPFYWEARKALANLIQTRDLELTGCHLDNTRKRYACKVQAEGKDIQAELVRMGMAWDWPKYSHGRYSQQEKDAKASKRGLWINDEASRIHWKKRERY